VAHLLGSYSYEPIVYVLGTGTCRAPLTRLVDGGTIVAMVSSRKRRPVCLGTLAHWGMLLSYTIMGIKHLFAARLEAQNVPRFLVHVLKKWYVSYKFSRGTRVGTGSFTYVQVHLAARLCQKECAAIPSSRVKLQAFAIIALVPAYLHVQF
jgi:hypothetical protein